MNENVRKRIHDIIRKNFDMDPDVIRPDEPISGRVSLDSMQLVSLIAQIEMELEVELPIGIIGVATMDEFYREIDKAVAGDIT